MLDSEYLAQSVVSVNLTRNEVRLIQALIADRHKVFGQDGVPVGFGETRVGLKILAAEILFQAKGLKCRTLSS